ncbi:MAG: F0F1 ATP synthase subunit A [Acetobacteraceae bacterium]|nr:F0F1 ATP synthase subunit A [Acetobacteraceae bacterium]
MAAAGETTIDALSQFRLSPVLSSPISRVAFANSDVWMIIAGLLTLALLWIGMRPRAIVPGRLQAAAELAYEFVYRMCIEQIGEEGKRFFPFIFTLFFFILFGNLLGLLPYAFTFTSHIAVTAALAVMVIVIVTVIAIRENGSHFFTEYFFPKGTPKIMAPLIIPIEIISYLSRPVSLSVRLFANMVAGHVMFEVLATFVVMLAGIGFIGKFMAIGPLALNTIMVGFEFLVACLQAYVFAILTCIYLHDAVHLH